MFDMFKYAEESGIKEGRKKGRDEERKKIISNMLKNGRTTDEICKDLGLTLMQFNDYTTEAVLQLSKKEISATAKGRNLNPIPKKSVPSLVKR